MLLFLHAGVIEMDQSLAHLPHTYKHTHGGADQSDNAKHKQPILLTRSLQTKSLITSALDHWWQPTKKITLVFPPVAPLPDNFPLSLGCLSPAQSGKGEINEIGKMLLKKESWKKKILPSKQTYGWQPVELFLIAHRDIIFFLFVLSFFFPFSVTLNPENCSGENHSLWRLWLFPRRICLNLGK